MHCRIYEVPFILSAISFIIKPIILRTGGLPIPIYLNGVPDTEFSWPVFIFFYVSLIITTAFDAMIFLSLWSFFLLSVLIFCYRFAALGDIIGQMKTGSRAENKTTLKYVYKMHLELWKLVYLARNWLSIN